MNIVSVIGRDAATLAKASGFSLESLGTCSSFHVEKPAKHYLARVTYFAIRRSLDSYSAFTCPTTSWESLRIMSLSADNAAANSILERMASYSYSLFEAQKLYRIACSILSPLGDFNCRPMPTPVCWDAPSTLRIHHFELAELVLDWGISTRKLARTCPFLASLGLYEILYSLSLIAHLVILLDKSGLCIVLRRESWSAPQWGVLESTNKASWLPSGGLKWPVRGGCIWFLRRLRTC